MLPPLKTPPSLLLLVHSLTQQLNCFSCISTIILVSPMTPQDLALQSMCSPRSVCSEFRSYKCPKSCAHSASGQPSPGSLEKAFPSFVLKGEPQEWLAPTPLAG